VVGPLAHTVADLRFFFKTILAAEPWFSDPKCIEVPWRQDRVEKINTRPLTFGIIKWDRLVMPHPPVLRGIKMVQEALKVQGHEIIEFDVPDAAEAESLTVLPLLPLTLFCMTDHSRGSIVWMEGRIFVMRVHCPANQLSPISNQ
jgi:Asp-tRNA(Asn)/Glu-tRNA(Gln) amidotransferase A subunit family amidase